MLWKPHGTKMSVSDWSRAVMYKEGSSFSHTDICFLVLFLICFPFPLLPHLIQLCIFHHVEWKWTAKYLRMPGKSSVSFLPRVSAGHGKTVTSDLLPASHHPHQAALGARYGGRASMFHLTALSHVPPSLVELSNAQRSHKVIEPVMMATLGLICTSMNWRPVKTPQKWTLLKYLHWTFCGI